MTSPRLLKGAIGVVDSKLPQVVNVIRFQYNPETVTRKLNPQWVQEGKKSRTLRLGDAPEETISLDVMIDTIDQLKNTEKLGIYPQLSILELLVYPKSEHVSEKIDNLDKGMIEILPPEAPSTLFIWGKNRVLPVQLTTFSITEEYHDADLNPILAKVSLSMRVLGYSDLPVDHPNFKKFQTYHQNKEQMARQSARERVMLANL